MTCREVRQALAGGGDAARTEAVGAHRAACAACEREARALTLLRIGTSPVAASPRAGFEARLRARIAGEPALTPLTWADGVGLVARPSLALATVALLLALAVFGLSYSRTASGDDLALVTGGDPLLSTVSINGIDGIDSADAPGVVDSGDAP